MTLVLLATSWLALQSASPMALHIDASCARVSESALRYALDIELQGALAPADAATADDAPLAHLTCVEDAVDVSLTRGSSVEVRHVDLHATQARDVPRLLSLVIAELVQHPLPPKPQAPPPIVPLAAAPLEPARPVRFFVLVDVRPMRQWLAWGGAVGGSVMWHRRWALDWEASYTYAGTQTPLGQVDGHLASAGAWPTFRARWGAWQGQVGLGGRIGAAFIHGRASVAGIRAQTSRGLWLAPSLLLKLSVDIGPTWGVLVRADIGRSVVGVEGQVSGQSAIAIAGWFGTFGVGVFW